MCDVGVSDQKYICSSRPDSHGGARYDLALKKLASCGNSARYSTQARLDSHRSGKDYTGGLSDLQTVMLQQAASIASSPRVIEAFSELNGEPSETLLRYLETVDLPARSTIACYSTQMDLIAWRGPDMPLSGEVVSILPDVQWTISRDGEWREALVVWHPIDHHGELIGASD